MFQSIHHAFSEPCLHASSKGVVRKTSHPLFAWLQELAPRGHDPLILSFSAREVARLRKFLMLLLVRSDDVVKHPPQ